MTPSGHTARHDPLRGVHGDPPGVRPTPGSMRRKGVDLIEPG